MLNIDSRFFTIKGRIVSAARDREAYYIAYNLVYFITEITCLRLYRVKGRLGYIGLDSLSCLLLLLLVQENARIGSYTNRSIAEVLGFLER